MVTRGEEGWLIGDGCCGWALSGGHVSPCEGFGVGLGVLEKKIFAPHPAEYGVDGICSLPLSRRWGSGGD